jgi:hypothetical protein
MFLIIAFIKSFRNEMLVVFFDIFGHEHKFETWFEKKFRIFFLSQFWSHFKFNFILGN